MPTAQPVTNRPLPADQPPSLAATRPYRRWRTTGFSSLRFGPCEVCGEHCSDVWIGSVGNESLFGHEACVAKAVA